MEPLSRSPDRRDGDAGAAAAAVVVTGAGSAPRDGSAGSVDDPVLRDGLMVTSGRSQPVNVSRAVIPRPIRAKRERWTLQTCTTDIPPDRGAVPLIGTASPRASSAVAPDHGGQTAVTLRNHPSGFSPVRTTPFTPRVRRGSP